MKDILSWTENDVKFAFIKHLLWFYRKNIANILTSDWFIIQT